MDGMDEKTKKNILEKNDKLINMVIERAKRDFPDDIAMIGLTGSFSTNDFHEKSDLDLIIINNTDRGWGISKCFILDDVGYDIYCTPWDTRIEAESTLSSPMVSCLVDLKILYCAKPEYMERFLTYKQRAIDLLCKPIGKECIERAKKWIDEAKQEYTNALLEEEIGAVRFAAGKVLHNCQNAITNLNNTYIKRGIKRYMEEMATYRYIPEDFDKIYLSMMEANTQETLRSTSFDMVRSVVNLYDRLQEDHVEHPVPTYDNLSGTYEELWCNCRNKVITSVNAKDKSYAFHAALGAQVYLNEMTEDRGTKKFDVMQYYNADNLELLKDSFIHIMDEYLEEYRKVGREVEVYETFDELYDVYMQG
jgi:predicted nucleotidyltransferase